MAIGTEVITLSSKDLTIAWAKRPGSAHHQDLTIVDHRLQTC